jgi:hypothetical protein
MSKKWKQPLTITFRPNEVKVMLMFLNERTKKLEKERLKAEARGKQQHPVARKTFRWAMAAKQRIRSPLAHNKREQNMANSIMVIKPYRYEGLWVFDDERTGLVKEALVAGVPEILEGLLHLNNIPLKSAAKGFRLIFSETPFPGYQLQAKHSAVGIGDGEEGLGSDEQTGNWYEVVKLLEANGQNHEAAVGKKGWLCPALFKYFDHTPATLYARVEEIKHDEV